MNEYHHPTPLAGARYRAGSRALSRLPGWRPALQAPSGADWRWDYLGRAGWVMLVLAEFVLLGTRGPLVALILAPIMAVLIAGFSIMSSSRLGLPIHFSFWITRCQIAVTPVLSLFLMLVFSTAFPQIARSPVAAVVFLLLPCAWLGGGVPAWLAHHPGGEAPPVRWLLAVGALIIGGMLWLSPLHGREATLLIPCCAGLALAMMRPLSYLWEVPLALVLSLATVRRAPASESPALHPAGQDEQWLLPLAGLGGLLTQIYANAPTEGVDRLLRIVRHRGRAGVARHAPDRAGARPQLPHLLLLRLGSSTDGAALLRDLAERSWKVHPLLAAHAALANTTDPAAWPAVIERHRPALAQAVDCPGGTAVLALLDTAAGILGADRWPAAVVHLGIAPIPRSREIDTVCARLDQLQHWADIALSACDPDQEAAPPAPLAGSLNPESWPARLAAAMREHLLFLHALDRRRASDWLQHSEWIGWDQNEDTAPRLCL